MSSCYQLLYATLVGRVDTAITYLEDMIEQSAFDWSHTVRVTEMLKSALLEAEKSYIEGAKDKI